MIRSYTNTIWIELKVLMKYQGFMFLCIRYVHPDRNFNRTPNCCAPRTGNLFFICPKQCSITTLSQLKNHLLHYPAIQVSVMSLKPLIQFLWPCRVVRSIGVRGSHVAQKRGKSPRLVLVDLEKTQSCHAAFPPTTHWHLDTGRCIIMLWKLLRNEFKLVLALDPIYSKIRGNEPLHRQSSSQL